MMLAAASVASVAPTGGCAGPGSTPEPIARTSNEVQGGLPIDPEPNGVPRIEQLISGVWKSVGSSVLYSDAWVLTAWHNLEPVDAKYRVVFGSQPPRDVVWRNVFRLGAAPLERGSRHLILRKFGFPARGSGSGLGARAAA